MEIRENFMNQESTISFDPEGAQRFPHIAAVEGFLGGVVRLVFEDGTVQFAENETYPDIVYSPQLPEPELEVFCGKHMAVYEQYFDENFEAMDRGDDLPPIDRFWE